MAVPLWISYGVGATPIIPNLGGRYLLLAFVFGFAGLSELIGQPFLRLRHYPMAVGLALNLVRLALILIPTVIMVAR